MNIQTFVHELGLMKQKVYEVSETQGRDVSFSEAFSDFKERTVYAIKLILLEKEIITFALLQWTAIALGYLLWVQFFNWVPAETWKAAGETSRSAGLEDLFILIWSFFCVGLVALPLGILTSCMGAAHFLHKQGEESTIASCFNIVLPMFLPIWIFSWVDGWITVNRILERLPRKNDRRTAAQKALAEAMYYAWKVSTIGIMPGLIVGQGIIESSKGTLELIKNKWRDILLLRTAYSALCWIVGIGAYFGAILFFSVINRSGGGGEAYEQMFAIYLYAGVPIIIAVGIVQLFLRPIYIIASCDIFSEHLKEKKEHVYLPDTPSSAANVIIVFCIMLLILFTIFLFRSKFGLV